MTESQKKRLSKMVETRFNEPLAGHVTFRVGGPAEAYAEPDEKQLGRVVAWAREEGVPLTILGNGSNVLPRDEGVKGLVLVIGRPMAQIRVEGEMITAGAGALLSLVAKAACEAGLAGLAFASGIPGSLGGGVMMNAGAYGGEMADVLVSVRALDGQGRVREYDAGELSLSYRHSRFMEEGAGEIILSAKMKLSPGDPEEIRSEMAELNARRREKQPLEYPSAGSAFKRPVGHFAGKLIQDAGLAGYQVGGAMVSPKHCGFIVNVGGATAGDILSVFDHVKKEVFRTSGVTLEEEVRIL